MLAQDHVSAPVQAVLDEPVIAPKGERRVGVGLVRWKAGDRVGDFTTDRARFLAAYLAPLRKAEWVVCAKRPFGGPEAVLADLSRYAHRVVISNSRLVAHDDRDVTFRWKDDRARDGAKGREWIRTMTLAADEFIRRFLLHVLPDGVHRIRHYGLFATSRCKANVARIRSLLPHRHRSRPNPSRRPTPGWRRRRVPAAEGGS